jgi:hypothetical protein
MVISADRAGANLPKRRLGRWKYLRAADLTPGSVGTRYKHKDVIDAIERDSFYVLFSENENVRPLQKRKPPFV